MNKKQREAKRKNAQQHQLKVKQLEKEREEKFNNRKANPRQLVKPTHDVTVEPICVIHCTPPDVPTMAVDLLLGPHERAWMQAMRAMGGITSQEHATPPKPEEDFLEGEYQVVGNNH